MASSARRRGSSTTQNAPLARDLSDLNRYLPELDGIRFFAIVPVLLFHLKFQFSVTRQGGPQ